MSRPEEDLRAGLDPRVGEDLKALLEVGLRAWQVEPALKGVGPAVRGEGLRVGLVFLPGVLLVWLGAVLALEVGVQAWVGEALKGVPLPHCQLME